MLKSLSLALLATFAFSGEAEAPKLSKEASEAISKAIESNLTEPNKLYDAYQASLAKAQAKVITSLEKLKADASDVKKGTMSLKDRSSLVDAIDVKIAEIRKGALNEIVSSRKAGDLLGSDGGVDSKTAIIGKWKYFFSPPRFAVLDFGAKGVIKNSNGNETSWRLNTKGELEILNNIGVVGRRFSWNESNNKWVVADVVDVLFPNSNAYIVKE